MNLGKVSVVIPARNEGQNLVDMVSSMLENTSYPDFEIIVVDDGSTDGSGDRIAADFGGNGHLSVARAAGLGVSGARNLGAKRAVGEILLFLDGHCYTPPGWMAALVEPLDDPQVGLVGPSFASLHEGHRSSDCWGFGATWRDISLETDWLPKQGDVPYPVPVLPGGCHVVRRSDFDRLGQYDEGMIHWGSEDLELSIRFWLMGYQVVVQPKAVIYHLFHKTPAYEVKISHVLHNRLRLALLHLHQDRFTRVLDYYRGYTDFAQAVTRLLQGDAMERSRRLHEMRSRDDDWYFGQFGCQI